MPIGIYMPPLEVFSLEGVISRKLQDNFGNVVTYASNTKKYPK